MTHTGVGPTQVNGLLTALNIPAISTRTLQCRQNETGMAIEKMAEETIQDVLGDEIQATLQYEFFHSVSAGFFLSVSLTYHSKFSNLSFQNKCTCISVLTSLDS